MPFAVRANSLATGVVSYRLLSVASTSRSRCCASAPAAHSGPARSAAMTTRASAPRAHEGLMVGDEGCATAAMLPERRLPVKRAELVPPTRELFVACRAIVD